MDFTDLYFTRYCSDAVNVWWYVFNHIIENVPQNVPVKKLKIGHHLASF